MSYFPLTIQRMDEETEDWTDYLKLHALRVNQPVSYGFGDRESHAAGAEQFHARLLFERAFSLRNACALPKRRRGKRSAKSR